MIKTPTRQQIWILVVWLAVINIVIYATNNIDPETGQNFL